MTQRDMDTSPQRPKKKPPPPDQTKEEEPRRASLAVWSSAPEDREETISSPAGRPTTVGRGQKTQREESGEEEDPDAES